MTDFDKDAVAGKQVNMPCATNTDTLKRMLIQRIGECLDEESLGGNGFLEMDNEVIHYAGEDGEHYFRVSLMETSEEEYFRPYTPVAEVLTAAMVQEAYKDLARETAGIEGRFLQPYVDELMAKLLANPKDTEEIMQKETSK